MSQTLCFVLCLISFNAFRAHGGVLQTHVDIYESDTVHLSCFTSLNEQVEWRINSRFQRTQLEKYQDSRRIYSSGGVTAGFLFTGRYSVSAKNGFYNLTITRVNISETGDYICHEALQNGPRTSAQLTVLANVSSIQDYISLSAFNGGSDFTVSCQANPKDNVRWIYVESPTSPQYVIFNGNTIESSYESRHTVHTNHLTGYYTLTLKNVLLNESGWYICIEDISGTIRETIQLTVLVNVSSLQQPDNSWPTRGSNVVLPCRSSSCNPGIRWLYIEPDNTTVQHVIGTGLVVESKYKDKATVSVDEITGEYKMSLHNVQLNESGWYVCIDEGNSDSIHVHPHFVTVSVDIASIQSHESWSRVNGSSVVLSCRSTDGGPVRWLHSESDITPQKIIFNGHSVSPKHVDKIAVDVDQDVGYFNLSLRNVQMNDSGYYMCLEVHSQLVHLSLLTVLEDQASLGVLTRVEIAVILTVIAVLLVGLLVGVVNRQRIKDAVGDRRYTVFSEKLGIPSPQHCNFKNEVKFNDRKFYDRGLFIHGIKFKFVEWSDISKKKITVLGAMEITYKSPDSEVIETVTHGEMGDGLCQVSGFELEKNERIVSVKADSGDCIDRVVFETNKRSLGPFGGNGGYGYQKDYSKCPNSRLAFVKGQICTDDVKTLRRVQFAWALKEKLPPAASSESLI